MTLFLSCPQIVIPRPIIHPLKTALILTYVGTGKDLLKGIRTSFSDDSRHRQ